MKKLVVALMVKNEEAIIERCLTSIWAFADRVIVLDTGSTDATVMKAVMFLQNNGIKFNVYTEPFVNFAHNRNRLLELAADFDEDYVLMIDADEVFQAVGNFKFGLHKDVYNVKMKVGDMEYPLPRITKNKANVKYVGVTHEYLDTGGCFLGNLETAYINQINDSFRRKNNQKFVDDARLLEEEISHIKDDTLKARYIFYLAQTYQNLNLSGRALEKYHARSLMGGWSEEIFYCYYQMGKIYESFNDHAHMKEAYIQAWLESGKTRIEPLFALKQALTRQSNPEISLMVLLEHVIRTTPKPTLGLFIEHDKYAK